LDIIDRIKNKDVTICVVGLGFVGLPLAIEFARKGFKTIAFDVDDDKIENLKKGVDLSREYEDFELHKIIKDTGINFASNSSEIRKADFIHICVPTLLDEKDAPDMRHIESASKTIGDNLKSGATVILESSVYPGTTEEVVKPILEKESKMKCGKDFSLGYSPERSSPGIKEHNLKTIVKVIGGIDEQTLDVIAELYKNVAEAGIFKASSIKVAETAKLMENIQRDLNIAMVNELSIICRKLGIDTRDVIDAAGSKFNFHKYYPGLVGGYCVPVNPKYLSYKAKKLGYEPKVITTGREINDYMPRYLADLVEEKIGKGGKVLIMGLSFKKNVKDPRESPVKDFINKLKEVGIEVFCYDPLIKKEHVIREFGVDPVQDIKELVDIDCVIILIGHDIFGNIKLDELKSISSNKPKMIDIQALFDYNEASDAGFEYIRL
jgi:UDP-N-acetyl-D-galactosamine dehydrogenase